jgi:hypothetical protein
VDIGNADKPRLGMTAFPMDQIQHFHDDNFRGFGHALSHVSYVLPSAGCITHGIFMGLLLMLNANPKT